MMEDQPMEEAAASIIWRDFTEADLPACLEIQPAHLGDELTGAEIARKVWRNLARHPSFSAAVYESKTPVDGHWIIGFGASVFVSAAFADAELAEPRPEINARFIASVHEGRPVLLSAADVARANAAGAGLDVLILYGSWLEPVLNPRQNAQVQLLLPVSFTELHAGYRFNRVIWEAAGSNEIRFSRDSGVYREIGTFPELNRVLSLVTRQEALSVPASLAGVMFTYWKPLLRLSGAEQQLLAAAQKGATDAELSDTLGLSLPAVKGRWRSIFARIDEVKPELAAEFDGPEGRGPQKRHRVLAYIRRHPEELRPYSWSSRVTEPGSKGTA